MVVPLSPVTEVVLPRKLRRDLIPDDFSFHDIDEHAMKVFIDLEMKIIVVFLRDTRSVSIFCLKP